jgi:hypothetical protein
VIHLSNHATGAREGEEVPVPRRLRGVGGQGAVRAVVVDELPQIIKGRRVRSVTELSASACSSQYVMPISRDIVVALLRCSCACSRLPVRR